MSTLPKERYSSKAPSGSARTGDNVRTFQGQSVLVGQLPEDFLRIDCESSANSSDPSQSHQIDIDQQLAASLQSQYNHQAQRHAQWASQYQAQLVITCVEARMPKNYGLVNMNPYLRLRVGHSTFETRTSHKGGKNPKWNESIRCYLPHGVETMSIEIYDECLLTPDDLIAWASFKFPARYLNFADSSNPSTFEETIVLSGKQGDDKEGVLLLVFTVKPITSSNMPVANQVVTSTVYPNPMPYIYAGPQFINPPVIVQSAEPATNLLPPVQIEIREEDVTTLHEMFPKIEVDVIKSVLTSERGNLDRAINNLLELNSTT